ncbi:MAG TPA: fused MFS/spermidine synthase [Thermoanaerobaculia bacterium]|nr:fused MFS/spermidine synthase [Thermoanaerobaculia bacterium]
MSPAESVRAAADPSQPSRLLTASFALACTVFFLSGLASLMDEVVWFKYLNLTLGSTTAATATLLAVFMGGLALGSWLFGRAARRLSRPATTYGLLEAGVAVFALSTPLLFDVVERGYVFAFRHVGEGPGRLTLVRAALAAAALLPPTILMGATFPVLSRLVERVEGPGRRSAALYAANTTGAVAGVVVAGMLLIPKVGLRATLLSSACISLVAALLALTLQREPLPSAREVRAERPVRVWLAVAFLTGAGAMAVEVLWTRILVLYLGSSVYSFSLMLAIYLSGLATGGFIGAVLPIREPRRRIAAIQLALGASLLVQVIAFPSYQKVLVADAMRLLHVRTHGGVLAAEAITTIVYLFVPTLLMGATFGVLLRAACRSSDTAPRDAGSVYAANTFGAIVGSLLAGFLAIPVLGTQNSLVAAGFLTAAVALLVFPGSWTVRLAPVAFAALALVPQRDGVILASGPFTDVARRNVLFYDEDVTATVAVKRYETPPALSLELNGVNVAGTSPDLLAVQKLQGHLPLLLAGRPERVLHVGFGSGGTAHAVSLHPVSRIRVVEISPEVLHAAARFFRPVNEGVLGDPRLTATINDGRNFILASPEEFDVILSDSIHPRYAGNGSLYTEEYFRLCAERLRPGGVISMWVPMYSLLPENYRSIVRAFRDVFPNVSIWYPNSVENSFTIVIATPEKTVRVRDLASRIDSSPGVRRDLSEIGADDPADVLSYLMLGPDDVTAWVAETEPHVDDRPSVEYESGRTLEHLRTWRRIFDELLARRGRIEKFVSDLSPGDPLAERVRERYRSAAAVLAAHRAILQARTRTEM